MATAKKQKRKRLVVSIEEKVEVVAMLDKGLNYICMNMYTMYDKSDTCSHITYMYPDFFTYPNKFLLFKEQRGPDNRGSTVLVYVHVYIYM